MDILSIIVMDMIVMGIINKLELTFIIMDINCITIMDIINKQLMVIMVIKLQQLMVIRLIFQQQQFMVMVKQYLQ